MNKKEELKQHLRDIIEDTKEPFLPIEVVLEKYAETLLEWFKNIK